MSKLQKLSKLARLLRVLTIGGMVLLPLAIIIGLATSPAKFATSQVYLDISPQVTQTQLWAAVALGLINVMIVLFILNGMRKLFTAYSTGEVLTDHCAVLIQRIGKGFVALAAANFLLDPLQMVLLTMANPPGQRSIAIGLNSDMIFFALSGGLIIVIGWAMREASDAAAENKAFV